MVLPVTVVALSMSKIVRTTPPPRDTRTVNGSFAWPLPALAMVIVLPDAVAVYLPPAAIASARPVAIRLIWRSAALFFVGARNV